MKTPAYYLGKPVTSLQTMLRLIAGAESLPPVIPDGIYGSKTACTVAEFQKKHGLSPTGVTNFATWNAILAAYEAARIECAPAAPLMVPLAANQTVREGDSGPVVLLMQAILHTASSRFGNLPDCPLCGVCEEKTAAALRALQKVCGRPETGCLDKGLWRLLAGLFTQLNDPPVPECACTKTDIFVKSKNNT